MTTIKELLPISNNKIGEEEVNAISARDLHAFLEVGRDFSTWIKNRIDKYDFIENQDFVLIPQNGGTKNSQGGDRRSMDYFISLDIVQPLIEFKEEALPKVSYHDKVLNSPDLENISEIAKDYPTSAIKLNKILQEEGVQYKDKKGEWALYAKYKDKGYASTKTQVIKNGEYEVLKVHLKWTQKGRLFIYELLKSKGILPGCEQPC